MVEKKLKKVAEESCPVRRTMDLIGGKWAFAIIYSLMDGTKRFKELERSITGINTRMLVKELKSLESTGIIRRKAYATVPPTVEYSLTDMGFSLKPIFIEIQNWAAAYS